METAASPLHRFVVSSGPAANHCRSAEELQSVRGVRLPRSHHRCEHLSSGAGSHPGTSINFSTAAIIDMPHWRSGSGFKDDKGTAVAIALPA
eukprot:CAMPEP_0204497740 /NCGR_PEP_ID=MMETSP0471-20130131/91485_1 /ASSEMBLY_ACC=CAM_ASM_000602 /TAXON_ID=2969 /ORGANISM="Oxyrrhis marina" /LENGTH=91 /DNA_ID=CAMNT_0051502161 /DNA_START=617 /DNA_END=892 /DNA_ORIENTATION=+